MKNLNKMGMFCFLLIMVGTHVGLHATSVDQSSEAVRVVARMYRSYAWEAMADIGQTSELFGKALADEPQGVLENYFASDLAALIAKDATCRDTHHGEVCHLDFNVIFASQDPAAMDLNIKQGGGGHVQVSYTYPETKEVIHLDYRMVRTAAGWRISDVIYPDLKSASLRRILSEKL